MRFLFLFLFIIGCSNYNGANFASDNGDVAIPITLKNLNFTVCKQSNFAEKAYSEYHCIELFTEKKFVLSVEEWWKVKHNFVWVSTKEIGSHIAEREFLKEQIEDLFKGKYKTLEFLKLYEFKK